MVSGSTEPAAPSSGQQPISRQRQELDKLVGCGDLLEQRRSARLAVDYGVSLVFTNDDAVARLDREIGDVIAAGVPTIKAFMV